MLKSVKKTYSRFRLGPIDWEPKGCVAIVGRNGSGKSTLFRLLLGVEEADEGSIYILGQRLASDSYMLRREIAYLPQELKLPEGTTPNDLLLYVYRLRKQKHPHLADSIIKKQISDWGIEPYLNKAFIDCSVGMQKRAYLASLFISTVPIFLLDEPFNGLDVEYVSLLEKEIARVEQESTVLFSSHILQQLVEITPRLLVLNEGEMSILDLHAQASIEERVRIVKQSIGVV